MSLTQFETLEFVEAIANENKNKVEAFLKRGADPFKRTAMNDLPIALLAEKAERKSSFAEEMLDLILRSTPAKKWGEGFDRSGFEELRDASTAGSAAACALMMVLMDWDKGSFVSDYFKTFTQNKTFTTEQKNKVFELLQASAAEHMNAKERELRKMEEEKYTPNSTFRDCGQAAALGENLSRILDEERTWEVLSMAAPVISKNPTALAQIGLPSKAWDVMEKLPSKTKMACLLARFGSESDLEGTGLTTDDIAPAIPDRSFEEGAPLGAGTLWHTRIWERVSDSPTHPAKDAPETRFWLRLARSCKKDLEKSKKALECLKKGMPAWMTPALDLKDEDFISEDSALVGDLEKICSSCEMSLLSEEKSSIGEREGRILGRAASMNTDPQLGEIPERQSLRRVTRAAWNSNNVDFLKGFFSEVKDVPWGQSFLLRNLTQSTSTDNPGVFEDLLPFIDDQARYPEGEKVWVKERVWDMMKNLQKSATEKRERNLEDTSKIENVLEQCDRLGVKLFDLAMGLEGYARFPIDDAGATRYAMPRTMARIGRGPGDGFKYAAGMAIFNGLIDGRNDSVWCREVIDESISLMTYFIKEQRESKAPTRWDMLERCPRIGKRIGKDFKEQALISARILGLAAYSTFVGGTDEAKREAHLSFSGGDTFNFRDLLARSASLLLENLETTYSKQDAEIVGMLLSSALAIHSSAGWSKEWDALKGRIPESQYLKGAAVAVVLNRMEKGGDITALSHALRMGADVNGEINGKSALEAVLDQKNKLPNREELMSHLLSSGARPDREGAREGRDAFFHCSSLPSSESPTSLVKTLLKHGKPGNGACALNITSGKTSISAVQSQKLKDLIKAEPSPRLFAEALKNKSQYTLQLISKMPPEKMEIGVLTALREGASPLWLGEGMSMAHEMNGEVPSVSTKSELLQDLTSSVLKKHDWLSPITLIAMHRAGVLPEKGFKAPDGFPWREGEERWFEKDEEMTFSTWLGAVILKAERELSEDSPNCNQLTQVLLWRAPGWESSPDSRLLEMILNDYEEALRPEDKAQLEGMIMKAETSSNKQSLRKRL